MTTDVTAYDITRRYFIRTCFVFVMSFHI